MLGPQLIMVLVYLWSRAYPTANVGFMGVVNFQARTSRRPNPCAAFLIITVIASPWFTLVPDTDTAPYALVKVLRVVRGTVCASEELHALCSLLLAVCDVTGTAATKLAFAPG